MTIPRRRILRPVSPPAPSPEQARKAQKVRHRLETERASLARWMSRLRRAFHATEKLQSQIQRLEKSLAQLEE